MYICERSEFNIVAAWIGFLTMIKRLVSSAKRRTDELKPQLHIHDFGHGRATTHPDLSGMSRSSTVETSARVLVVPW